MSEESCGRLVVYFLLSSCIHLTMSTVFVLFWPHCQSLHFEKLLVLAGVGAHVPPSHRLCFTMFTKVPTLRAPEHREEVISPQLWDSLYYPSSRAILIGLCTKVSQENRATGSPFTPSLDCSRAMHLVLAPSLPLSLGIMKPLVFFFRLQPASS